MIDLFQWIDDPFPMLPSGNCGSLHCSCPILSLEQHSFFFSKAHLFSEFHLRDPLETKRALEIQCVRSVRCRILVALLTTSSKDKGTADKRLAHNWFGCKNCTFTHRVSIRTRVQISSDIVDWLTLLSMLTSHWRPWKAKFILWSRILDTMNRKSQVVGRLEPCHGQRSQPTYLLYTSLLTIRERNTVRENMCRNTYSPVRRLQIGIFCFQTIQTCPHKVCSNPGYNHRAHLQIQRTGFVGSASLVDPRIHFLIFNHTPLPPLFPFPLPYFLFKQSLSFTDSTLTNSQKKKIPISFFFAKLPLQCCPVPPPIKGLPGKLGDTTAYPWVLSGLGFP